MPEGFALLFVIAGVVILLAVVVCISVRDYKRRVENELAEERRRIEEERRRTAREAEENKKEIILAAKEEALKIRQQVEDEVRVRRAEVQKAESRLDKRQEALDNRQVELERRLEMVKAREAETAAAQEELQRTLKQQREELQRISGLTADEAKRALLAAIEQEIRHDSAKLLRQIEEETRREAERRAAEIVTTAIQRCAVDQTTETTVSVVPLPNDEMKGRIIGREGRNIRAFEQLTGVDLIVDDTPEAVVISAFDPIRREVARLSLEALVADARIHPGKIEEVVERQRKEIQNRIREAAEQAVLETGVTGLHPELLQLLGKLHYRTSLGQNVLRHSVEVAHLAGMMATELGVDAEVAKRAGLLHDIGKAVDFEVEGPHALIGRDILKKYGESEAVIHAVTAHHSDVEQESVEAVLVQTADAISASRPGARREPLEAYIRRLERLEAIADSFDGVGKSYAIHAGREIRVIVKPEKVDDLGAARLAKNMVKAIQEQLTYPGQIRVTVIRETRVSEYAK